VFDPKKLFKPILTNTLSYYDHLKITDKNRFITLGPDVVTLDKVCPWCIVKDTMPHLEFKTQPRFFPLGKVCTWCTPIS
jgi:hypothetical protein